VPVGTVDEWRWTGPTGSFDEVAERYDARRLRARAAALATGRGAH
jgi:hypothetical protein